jgi:hypothetical protein
MLILQLVLKIFQVNTLFFVNLFFFLLIHGDEVSDIEKDLSACHINICSFAES